MALINILQSYMSRLLTSVSMNALFTDKINLFFDCTVQHCTCGKQLKKYKTKTRRITGLLTGECNAHITQLHCGTCKRIYDPEELGKLVPKHSRFSFDVIVYVGTALFVHHCNDEQIQKSLKEKNISISLREIAYLGRKFIVYLASAHRASQEDIRKHIKTKGGYILHLDGTCEGDSPHLFSFIDELSSIVLDNVKLPSENARQIMSPLEEIKKAYGTPLAVVHDMSAAIINAVESVFPGVRDFICHLHFLRDLGKDLFSTEYNSIRRLLKTAKTRASLRKLAREFKNYIEQDEKLKICLERSMGKDFFDNCLGSLMPPVALYLLISWVLESKNKSHGYGFPFDRPQVDFCDRLQHAYPMMISLKIEMPGGVPKIRLAKLGRTLNDISLKNSLSLIKEKISVFDELRDIMRIVPADGQNGLNDNGEDAEIKTIEAGVKQFRKSEKITNLAKINLRFKNMVKQVDKYWNKLFADPIEIKTEIGTVMIQPQRTNNMLEQFFRKIKSGCRKKSGTSSLSKTLKAMMANTPLVKNLSIPKYVEIILNGKKNLEERFAEIDSASVRDALKKEDEASRKYPKGMAKIFRIVDFPSKIERIVTNKSNGG